VDGHGRSTTASLVELRLRLYRPEPPVGAVAAYLDALRNAPVLRESPPVVDPTPPRRARALATLVLGACVLGAATGAVLLGRQVPAAVHASTVEAATAGTATSGSRLPAPPLTGVPLGDLFGSGRATGTFTANDHRVVASVLCTGSGTIEVRIGAEPPTVLTCQAGLPALAIVASAAPLDRFTIVVTPDGPIRWSLAAGALAG
jgi:hypothetical protein